jgi:hypothetical protein
MKEDGMGRACGMYGVREKWIEFWWRNQKERDHLENLDEKVML